MSTILGELEGNSSIFIELWTNSDETVMYYIDMYTVGILR